MKHPKTTIGGVCLIVGSLATFVGQWVANGMPNADAWTIMFTGLNMGVVAVLSADGHTVNQVTEEVKQIEDKKC